MTQDSSDKTQIVDVFSSATRNGNMTMCGTLHADRQTGDQAGWLVNAWSDGFNAATHLLPKLHWVPK